MAVAGVLSMGATANAATLSHPHKAPTALSVKVSAPTYRGHGRDTISGKLTEGRKAVANQTVSLDVVSGRHLVPVGTARTNRNGAVSFTVAPKRTTTYDLVFGGTRTLAGSKSAAVTIRVTR